MELRPSILLSRGSIVHTETGTVIQTDHGKFLVVVGEIDGQLGLVCINSKPRSRRPESQVEIGPESAKCLSHVSYIDCGELNVRPKARLEKLMREGRIQYRGAVGADVWARAAEAALKCATLSQKEKDFFRS